MPTWIPSAFRAKFFAKTVVFLSLMALPAGHLTATAQPYIWQQQQAKALPNGDLEWSPQPFVFQAGTAVRYIDFSAGSDANSGLSPQAAWKHHPWDAAATGTAKTGRGNFTYVFKRGVTYRGKLTGTDAGTVSQPIRLTSDPAWGSGEAVLAGSEVVTGWQIAGSNAPAGMPGSNLVWYADVPFFPRRVWAVAADGAATRLKLARTPNWSESNPDDPMREWWYWENPYWWRNPNPHVTTNAGGTVMHLGIDTAHLTRSPDYYSNALVWTEWGIVMGTPFPSTVEVVDPKQHGLGFQGFWYGTSGTIMRGCRYYLEDKPHYLDEPGEFWAESRPGGARLYLRLPGDQNPADLRIEAASRVEMIDMTRLSNVRIAGLTFAFGNAYRDLTARFYAHADVLGAAIRLQGTGTNLSVSNCKFHDVNLAVRLKAVADTDRLDQVSITDNEIVETDHGAIDISDSSRWAKFLPPFGTLGKVEILRNRIHNTGVRPARSESGHGVVVQFAENATVAGNLLTRAHGAGLWLFGGKGDNESRDKPFSRLLVFQNKVQDSLLKANDWGGIETWQGGPHYVFNNLSGNPRGFWHWTWLDKSAYDKTNTASGLGQAYYLDGSFKNYLFNNIAWGKPGDSSHPWSASAFQMVIGFHNQIFNNTAFCLTEMSRRYGAAGGRVACLGNIFAEFPFGGFTSEAIAEQAGGDFAPRTLAFSSNIFTGRVPVPFARFETNGTSYGNLNAFSASLANYQPYASDVGVQTAAPVLQAPVAQDFRLSAASAACDRGVKVFVPWALARTVGEWQFRHLPADPTLFEDDHWYMAPYYTKRADNWKVPQFPLRAVGVGAEACFTGPLEDWCAGALGLNGTNQFLVCSNADMKQPYAYTLVKDDFSEVATNASGSQLWNPDLAAEGFVLETVLRVAPGRQGLIVGKSDSGAGWEWMLDDAGRPALNLKSAGIIAASFVAGASVADGVWHHLLVEVTRGSGGGMRLWIDGVLAAGTSAGTIPTASLVNSGDLLVGGGPGRSYLACDLEFLRIARGTLAEAQTTAEELYAWEFSGPFLRDFTGTAPVSTRRDAGALEYGFTTNGVPTAWLAGFGLNGVNPDAAAAADLDSDGMPTWLEYLAGTDPLNLSSSFRISQISRVNQALELRWPGGTNGSVLPFFVQATTNLSAGWFDISGALPHADNGTNVWTTAPAGNDKVFYRVRIGY